MGKRISFCQGKGNLAHNNRLFISDNVDKSRTKDNITFISIPLDKAYENLFKDSVERYNEKQTRSDRKISDYFEKLFGRKPSTVIYQNANKQKSFYEDLIQVGTMDDTGNGTVDAEIAKKCLCEYIEGFQERNPNFYLFNAVLHADEATPHIHLDYIPFGHFSRGMDIQNSLSKALEEMGYGKDAHSISRWRESERKIFEEICIRNGFEIEAPQKSRGKSYPPDEFKEAKESLKKLERNSESVKLLEKIELKPDKKIYTAKDVHAVVDKAVKAEERAHQLEEQNKILVSDKIKNGQLLFENRREIFRLKAENNYLKEKVNILTDKLKEKKEAVKKSIMDDRSLSLEEMATKLMEQENNRILLSLLYKVLERLKKYESPEKTLRAVGREYEQYIKTEEIKKADELYEIDDDYR